MRSHEISLEIITGLVENLRIPCMLPWLAFLNILHSCLLSDVGDYRAETSMVRLLASNYCKW